MIDENDIDKKIMTSHDDKKIVTMKTSSPTIDSDDAVIVNLNSQAAAVLYPPLRFGRITPKIFRGAYPTLKNFRFLRRLYLKSIISFIPEVPTDDLTSFAALTGIELTHFQITQTPLLNSNLQQQLLQALQIVLSSEKQPVYLHCLDGRRVSGLFAVLLRRCQGWSPLSCITEYWRYQTLDRFSGSVQEVEKASRDIERFISDIPIPIDCMWLPSK